MTLVHTIWIDKPIWKKPRSVGLKLVGLHSDTLIHVNIDYENKKGVKLWPHTLAITWMKASSYPIQKLKNGTILNIIPIQDFTIILPEEVEVTNSKTKSTIKSNQQMTAKKKDEESFVDIWSNEAIDAHEEKHSEKGTPKEIIPFGERILCITKAELTLTKKHNEPMIKLTIEDCDVADGVVTINEDYYPIQEYYIVGGDRKTKGGDRYISQIGADKIRSLMLDGFSYKFKAIAKDDFEALVNQISDFFNKPFRAAVRHVSEIYKSKKDGKLHQVTRVNMWYTGNYNDMEFKVNDTKMVVGLSDADKTALEMDAGSSDDDTPFIEDDDSNPFG